MLSALVNRLTNTRRQECRDNGTEAAKKTSRMWPI